MKIQVKFEIGDLDLLFKVTGGRFVCSTFLSFLTKVMDGFLSNSVDTSLLMVSSTYIPGFDQFKLFYFNRFLCPPVRLSISNLVSDLLEANT